MEEQGCDENHGPKGARRPFRDRPRDGVRILLRSLVENKLPQALLSRIEELEELRAEWRVHQACNVSVFIRLGTS
jgi:hypothetical protein